MRTGIVLTSLLSLIALFPNESIAAKAVNAKLNPTGIEEEAPSVLKDMGVVQKKEFSKKGKFLLSTFMSLEFADGPSTIYAINFNPGYALSEFFEVYVNLVPVFLTQERSIVQEVSKLQLANGRTASITAADPKYQFGIEGLWAFGYGKESVGLSSLLRSDTFIKAGASIIKYPSNNGWRIHTALGKSFFIGKWASFRLSIGSTFLQTIVEVTDSNGARSAKQSGFFAFIESGFVLYL